MEEALEFEISGSGGFAPIARRVRSKSIFRSSAQASDIPGKTAGANLFGDDVREAIGKRDHVPKRRGREDVFERRAHRGQRECVAGECAADAANVYIFKMKPSSDALRDFFRNTIGGARNAAGDGLSENENIRL